ncbi:hypothetical protein [Streptomyces sp. B1I3]|uniref:hypothetical protein n=1 Tax=Streptomyces sp. B1I3 TaxID=3042264 RepID=UPI002780CEC3|nr:hypothetical protein [Streptomyces sp. B1I3]MDQ0791983.1 hypothetical protein [Streptomyces sp. B1I3]
MDLHTWITQQVDRAEEAARAELEHRLVVFQPHNGGPAITGVVTGTTPCADGIQLDVSQCGVEPRDGTPAPVESVTATLRRCEADRRILARHNVDPEASDSQMFATACHGCGTYGYCDDPNTENLNDCPELLDLAHAHGITPATLAGLDRPQSPEPNPSTGPRLAHWLTPPITTSDVPASLRGPRWKP